MNVDINNAMLPIIAVTLDQNEYLSYKHICEQMLIADQNGNAHELKLANENLAGQIQYEFRIDDKHYDKILETFKPAINEHLKRFPDPMLRSTNQNIDHSCLKVLDCWVNFQQKHEYNPPHSHSGIFSFVLWMKVPYLIEDEMRVKNCHTSKEKWNGHFYFLFNPGVALKQEIAMVGIPADKTYEGKGVLFPSSLWHGVNPFYTSDEYRISISGNFGFKF